MQNLIVADSSVWIEVLTGGPKAAEVKKYLGETLLVPEITLAEIAAKLYSYGGWRVDVILKSICQKGHVRGLNPLVAARAGELRAKHKDSGLSLNDAVIWATAEYYGAKLLTLDKDFVPFRNAIVL
ncbi:PIN domain-containing protein [Candidatus Micrarchaeota archaeon]|nr:PIN domain-containing protein [Candidatus Micrarchaeota archaeon]